jgi:ribosomal protein S27E
MSDKKMTVMMTCPNCESAVTVYPDAEATQAACDICEHQLDVKFTAEHEQGIVKECPCCERKDFYKQKDFNRKVGVILFVIAAVLSIWTYGLSLIALWLVDFFLFQKLPAVVICYKCSTIFRQVNNTDDIHDFNHEMNDRIVYSDHDFEGKVLDH